MFPCTPKSEKGWRATYLNGKELIKEVEETTNLKGNTTFGTPENPQGITIYDKTTGEPYCLEIDQGEIIKTLGKCGSNLSPDIAGTPYPAQGYAAYRIITRGIFCISDFLKSTLKHYVIR